MLDIRPTDIAGVLLITARVFEDDRGTFSETYNRARWRDHGIAADFIQDNTVLSRRAGTVRGLHFQRPPTAQAKLVRVVHGAVWDVVVDIRAGSPTYGRWTAIELSAANRQQVFIPTGLAHGYVSLLPDTEITYKVDAPYAPQQEAGIAWDDPALGIPWPLPQSGPVIADRDRGLPRLGEAAPCFTWTGGGA